ncbi:MAG: selenocysteine-specific translation elongation factor [Candidatus Marinimicrobia bacterium]|jgi:selenocysteine-specific elongation factor|nr:selenocysteine-specific translation elongation factor [Candidatus Neomarinimicrobiota bacterium]MDP6726234.1 selenocysteine-specific translation elongation factor [Candidatus Neomarinimicrobiota bacterium]|tara:strand:- start:41241 stop:43103 length:1863 start_codon:yes stop_codon:yes gene_type:complete
MTQVVIGTAGHIDHGKTALVKALTGTDTDRLAEEKARGMTIDLGFAFLNESITIIDVPGHEKFIRNMVAGVSTINIALLVVAADDGIMPQTREHLHILKLLNIPQCVVALTKTDLAEDGEWLDLIELEIRELTEDIFENVDVVRTSVQTNEGIDDLKHLLEEKSAAVQLTEDESFFRLQADRVFSMTGFGTVVTGTVISGRLKKGDTVDVLPGNISAKVRGIQSHGAEVESVQRGDRAAVNLSGVEAEKVFRGSELATKGKLKAVSKFTAHLQLTADMNKELKHRQRVRVHLGTAEVMARIYLTSDKKMTAGSSANVIIVLEEPTVMASEDRLVMRSYSPMHTIGGGTVLTTFIPKGVKIKKWVSELDLDLEKRFGQLVVAFKLEPKTVFEWGNAMQMTDKHIRNLVKNTGLKSSRRSFIYSDENVNSCSELIVKRLEQFHDKNPLRKAMSADVLQQESGLSEKWLAELLDIMEKDASIRSAGTGVALASHKVELAGGTAEISRKMEDGIMESGFIPVTTEELSKKLKTSHKDILEILHVLKSEDKVVEIKNDVWMHSENMAKLRKALQSHFDSQNEMNVADFKNMSGLTRKFAIPVLEYCDKQGWTERDGNVRLKGTME